MSATGGNLSKKVHIFFKVQQDTELVVVDNPVLLVMFVSNTLFSFVTFVGGGQAQTHSLLPQKL